MSLNNQQPSKAQNSSSNRSKWNESDLALSDVKSTFGFVPEFTKNFTDQSLPGAWAEAKILRFGPSTALDLKTKGLIATAVAAQIPCELISYFEHKATKSDGATRQEQIEAVLMAAITRHWSTVLNGSLLDKDEFRKEADKVFAYVKKMMADSGNQTPPEEMFLMKPQSADEAYKDIEKTLGLVPNFFKQVPKDAIAGAWSEFKAVQLNPHTQLSGKQKELIGLAVAAQIPCEYCVYFHRNAAQLNGASEQEIQEAIALAGLTRHWSTVFHGPQIDMASFRKDADKMLQNSAKTALQ